MNLWVMGMTSALLISACWTDLRRLRIPNVLTLGFAVLGLGYHAVHGGWSGIGGSFAGAAAGIFPLLLLFRLKGMGGGDVKWFGAFGIWTGALPTLQLLFYSILFAGGISVLLLLLGLPVLRQWGGRMPWPWGIHPTKAGRRTVFPFMLAVTPCFVWMAFFDGMQVS
jgi:prepilin peptidase CpaA